MTPLQMYLLRSGSTDPRAGVDMSGASVQRNPGFGMNFGTGAQLLGTAALPTPIGLGIGLFNKVMGPWGVVGGPTAPQIGGHFPGGTQKDMDAANKKRQDMRTLAKALNTARIERNDAGSSSGQAVGSNFSGGGSGAFGRGRRSRPDR